MIAAYDPIQTFVNAGMMMGLVGFFCAVVAFANWLNAFLAARHFRKHGQQPPDGKQNGPTA